MTTITVSSGFTSTGLVLNYGDELDVLNGGTADGTTVNSGGVAFVSSGGTASDTQVTSGGFEIVSSGGIASVTTVSSGGFQFVSDGGTTIGTTVENGGYTVISNGGTAVSATVDFGGFESVSGVSIGTTVNSGGAEIVAAAGVASAAILNAGGTLVVLPGGSATGATGAGTVVSTGIVVTQANVGVTVFASVATNFVLGTGDVAFVLPGGVVSGTVVTSGGTEDLFPGGNAVGTAVSYGGAELVFSGATASLTMVSAGGSETVDFGGSAVSVTVSSGATQFVTVGGNAQFTTLDSGGIESIRIGGSAVSTTVSSGGFEVISAGGTASLTVLEDGGNIDVTSLAYVAGGSASVDPLSDVLTVSVGGATYTQQLVGNYTGDNFVLASDGAITPGTMVTAEAACYRAGTLVTTQRGGVAVEDLRPGDRVQAAFAGWARVNWIGHRRVDCRRHPRPENVWPVRVAAGAFGEGVPRRDLFLSPDHSVHVAGVLVPIRYLINDATITQQAMDEVMYWHVELASHDVILAEGLPAESYLDTGNRGAFVNGGTAVQMHPDFALRVWETQSCAPLVMSGAVLASVRRQLLARADTLGHETTDDGDLRVLAGGRILRPVVERGMHCFLLPSGTTDIRMLSRNAVPAMMHADSDDHRRLGVAIARIAMDGQAMALDDARIGDGWHGAEARAQGGTLRWTDGDAGLIVVGVTVLEVELAMSARTWREATPAAMRVA